MPSTIQAQVTRYVSTGGPLEWVKYSDYQALQAALGEALDEWEQWMAAANVMSLQKDAEVITKPLTSRIAELRKLPGEP